jgi:hypothetical protein
MYQIRRRRSATLILRAVNQFSVINPHGGDGLGYPCTIISRSRKGDVEHNVRADELSGTCCWCIMEETRGAKGRVLQQVREII